MPYTTAPGVSNRSSRTSNHQEAALESHPIREATAFFMDGSIRVVGENRSRQEHGQGDEACDA